VYIRMIGTYVISPSSKQIPKSYWLSTCTKLTISPELNYLLVALDNLNCLL